MNVTVPYASGELTASLPRGRMLGTLTVASCPPIVPVEDALECALAAPIGCEQPLEKRFHPGESALIIVSDHTRKTGVHLLLPRLIHWLNTCGIAPEAIAFLIASGVHRPANLEEQTAILGAGILTAFQGRIHNHNAHDAAALMHVGNTQRGTPVYLNRLVDAYDHVILTGSVVMHYFAGFGGGRKALMPGVAGATTIAHNHALNLHPAEDRLNPAVRIGVLDGNPVAEDMLEAARMHPPEFIVNTVLNRDGDIAGLFVGELDAAHRAACAFARERFGVPIQEQADLVIAAMPTASNFIQCHKALFNAWCAMKPGGRIVLLAPAPEGLGGDGFRRYLEMRTPAAVVAALRRQADINGQTALSTLQKTPNVILISELAAADVNVLGARKADTLEHALALACDQLRQTGVDTPTCLLMPDAGLTVPIIR